MEITKFRSQLSNASEQVTVYLRLAQNALTRLGRSVADKPRRLREALRAKENDLQRLLASSHDAIVVTNGKITKFRSQLSNASEQVTVYLRLAQNALTRLGRSVADKPRRLREALRAKENDLQRLLASSHDAIVVTNVDRSFVAANPKALDLFGVSETNMKKFTIDAFLSHSQFLYFTRHGLPFIGREKGQGKCKIRRLDGSLRIAEYIFVANVVPNRHLCRFRNVKMVQLESIATFSSAAAVIQIPACGTEDTRKSKPSLPVPISSVVRRDSAEDKDAALAAGESPPSLGSF
jgi:PAS domain S-box-containing protein